MHSLALSLAFTGLAVLSPNSVQTPPSLLHAAPADALFVAYTPDLGAVREAAAECPWYRYFAAGPGREYLDLGLAMMQDLGPEVEHARSLCRPLTGLCEALAGEALVFATTDGLGIVLATGERQEVADQALTDFLEGLPVIWTVTMSEHEGTFLQLWQPDDEDFVLGRAMGGGVSAFFLGESPKAVHHSLRRGIDDYLAGELTADARRIQTRLRGDVPRVVVTADFQKLAGVLAEKGGARPRQGRRVIRALGLDQEAWLLADLHRSPSGQIHEVVKVRFQPETGLARLADSFRPLEMSDLAGLPEGTESFAVARWDVTGFVDTVLELAGPEARKTWRTAQQAGQSATGVHFRKDLVDQLTGRFAVYQSGDRDGSLAALLDPLHGSTLLVGVRDGEAFGDTLLDLVEATGSGGMLEIDDCHGMDVWSLAEGVAEAYGLPAPPRLVFTPEAVLVVSAAQDLEEVLAPFTGEGRPALTDRSAPVEAIRRHAGAFFVGYQDLAAAADAMTTQLHGLATLLGLEVSEPPDRAALERWFPGQAISSWLRTEEGLEFRTTIR